MPLNFDSERKPPGAVSRHEYTTWSGERIVVWRGPGGRFLPGHRMAETRDPSKLGRSIVDPKSALRRALGLSSNRHKGRAKE